MSIHDDRKGEWWKGKAWDQDTHARINARHYPGTRQLCAKCDSPTGRCEEDSMYTDAGEGPFCEECYAEHAATSGFQP